MNTQIIAVIIQEGTRLAGQWFRNRPVQISKSAAPLIIKGTEHPEERIPIYLPGEEKLPQKATEIPTGCIPCAIGHLGTCSGLLNEAMRFARDDATSDEVVDRVGMCLDELNAMERVDLRPEMVTALPDWEKELVEEVLTASRTTRHSLESIVTAEALEEAAARTQNMRTQIWRKWLKSKMANLTPEETAKIQARVREKLDELGEEGEE